MIDIIIQTFAASGISISVTAFFIWLFRIWVLEKIKSEVKHEYDEKLETHKAQLKSQADVQLEQFRSDLNFVSSQKQAVFLRLYEKRADVIADVYAKLANLMSCMESYVSISLPLDSNIRVNRRAAAANALVEFEQTLKAKAIFIPSGLEASIELLSEELTKIFSEYTHLLNLNQNMDPQKYFDFFKRLQIDASETLQGLKGEFRHMLGDE